MTNTVAIRGTNQTFSTATSVTIPWPANTAVNDLVVISCAGGFSANTPATWTQLYSDAGQANWEGVSMWKVMTSSDISNSNVTLSITGSFNGVYYCTSMVGGTFKSPPMIWLDHHGSTTGGANFTGNVMCTDINNMMLYTATNRAAGSNNVVNMGTLQQHGSDNTAASGALYAGTGQQGNPLPFYTFSSNGSGFSTDAIMVQCAINQPSWLRGSGPMQCSTASSFTVPWPSGTVTNDMVFIMVASGFAVNSAPSGWTFADNNTGANWQGSVMYKTMTSSDISNSNVTVVLAGSFNSVVDVLAVKGSSLPGYGVPVAKSQRNSGGAAQRSVVFSANGTKDITFGFGSMRGVPRNGGNTSFIYNPVCQSFNYQESNTDNSSASGCTYAGSPAASGNNTTTFDYLITTASGDYSVVVNFGFTGVPKSQVWMT